MTNSASKLTTQFLPATIAMFCEITDMYIELNRTFNRYLPQRAATNEADLMRDDRVAGRLTWADLYRTPVVVVLGEAGIGKTVEFQLEVSRLKKVGHVAFFISLSLLKSAEDWQLALGSDLAAFTEWENSAEEAYFFLDAVDESRLLSHTDFTRALRILQIKLGVHMARVHVALSSRGTDWTVEAVPEAVMVELTIPIARTRVASSDDAGERASLPSRSAADSMLVVTLAPLSNAEARRCARHFDVRDEAAFWNAIQVGAYDFMASRPLDLRWMVDLWNAKGRFGTYMELMEANINARINEANPSYQQAGRSLPKAVLRNGATRIAAAAEFGGHTFISVQPGGAAAGLLDAHAVLSEWKQIEVQLLLSSALFDEATFGRVRFHHRSMREYLAAIWVDHELYQGIPWHRTLQLMTARPFGDQIMIPARRACLSWLTAINVKVRSWTIQHFPELLFFQGDPESWDKRSISEALKAFVIRSKSQLRTVWRVDDPTYVRIARVVDPADIAAIVADDSASASARTHACELARVGKITECAKAVFDLYCASSAYDWRTSAALHTLEVIATSAHRTQVLNDIVSNRLKEEEALADALPVLILHELSSAQLLSIFDSVGDSARFHGFSPIAIALDRLARKAALPSALVLLEAALSSCSLRKPEEFPAPPAIQDVSDRDWRIDLLVACLERVLEIAKVSSGELPEVCARAAARIDGLRLAGLVEWAEVNHFRAAIDAIPMLRWQTVLEIVRSEPICLSKKRLVEGAPSIINLRREDLKDLLQRALDTASTSEDKAIWLELYVDVVFRLQLPQDRLLYLRLLPKYLTQESALLRIKYLELRSHRKIGRKIAAKQYAYAATLRQPVKREHEQSLRVRIQAELEAAREQIAAGNDVPGLTRLVQASNPQEYSPDGSRIDVEAVARRYGAHMADAFLHGVVAYRQKAVLSSPLLHFASGRPQLPAAVRIARAAVDQWIANGCDCATLSAMEVAVIAQVAIWSSEVAPDWLGVLCRHRAGDVVSALCPWLLDDLLARRNGYIRPFTLTMILSCPSEVKIPLLNAAIPLVYSDKIADKATLRQVVVSLHDEHIVAEETFDALCCGMLEKRADANGRIDDWTWLMLWMSCRPRSAIDWVTGHLAAAGGQRAMQIRDIVQELASLKSAWWPSSSDAVNLLTDLCNALFGGGSSYIPTVDTPEGGVFLTLINQLTCIRGIAAREGLQYLTTVLPDAWCQDRLRDRLIEHAEKEATAGARWSVEELRALHIPFDTTPTDEAQLYEQVMARLEDIRVSVQEGPFSERLLFKPGIPEKHLQLWLAAKLQDTQNLRFSIHREEEVDDDKRTDIQCACAAGKVCVEIKPLDQTRSYSAATLVNDTLQQQVATQYLKGRNSAHGILVLMQLDDKEWVVPGETERSFSSLLKYLQLEADKIRARHSLAKLQVFGIRCTI